MPLSTFDSVTCSRCGTTTIRDWVVQTPAGWVCSTSKGEIGSCKAA